MVAISCMIGLVFGYFFNRWNREYITKKTCDDNRLSCKAGMDKEDAKFYEFKKEMREGMGIIKGLLLVIASGGKVAIEDLKELLK